MKSAQQNRQRFNPEVRRIMILDKAAELVASEGVSALSLEHIGKSANISKSLMYKYFNGLNELLSELLTRELETLRKAQSEAAERATTFEELVGNITHTYLSYIEQRGQIIERLQNEPNISQGQDPTHYDRESSVKYLANIATQHFDLPTKLAEAATDISFGLPAAAGEYLLKGNMSRAEIERLTVTMIIGTFTSVRNEYLAKGKKLPR